MGHEPRRLTCSSGRCSGGCARGARSGGPKKAVFFPQTHTAGRMGSIDFTNANALGVTIAGAVFAHMFFHMVLPFSGWHFVQLAFSVTDQPRRDDDALGPDHRRRVAVVSRARP